MTLTVPRNRGVALARFSATPLTRVPGLACLLTLALALAACGKESPQALLASGKAYAAKREHKAAIVQYKAALQADGQLAEVRFQLGKSLLESGDGSAAVVELSKAFVHSRAFA